MCVGEDVSHDRWCANVRLYLLFQICMVTFQMCAERMYTPCIHPLPTTQAFLLLSVYYRKVC